MKLKNKVALVTGAGRGIGEAIANSFAQEGAAVMLVSRTESEVAAVASRITARGGRAGAIAGDVSRPDDVERIASRTRTAFGPIDVLVNSAGVYGPIGPMWKADVEQWVDALKTNLVGTFLCCRTVLPEMIERRNGRIINLAGGGAASPVPRFSAYACSKAAVARLTETLAEEVREYGVSVNAIAPGLIDTKLQDRVLEAGPDAGDLFDRINRLRAEGKGGVSPEIPAALAVFLASDASAGLTGRLIAAPHDGWEKWDANKIERVMETPWFTVRRIDPFTLKSFAGKSLDD